MKVKQIHFAYCFYHLLVTFTDNKLNYFFKWLKIISKICVYVFMKTILLCYNFFLFLMIFKYLFQLWCTRSILKSCIKSDKAILPESSPNSGLVDSWTLLILGFYLGIQVYFWLLSSFQWYGLSSNDSG